MSSTKSFTISVFQWQKQLHKQDRTYHKDLTPISQWSIFLPLAALLELLWTPTDQLPFSCFVCVCTPCWKCPWLWCALAIRQIGTLKSGFSIICEVSHILRNLLLCLAIFPSQLISVDSLGVLHSALFHTSVPKSGPRKGTNTQQSSWSLDRSWGISVVKLG